MSASVSATGTAWQPTLSLRSSTCSGVDLACANTAASVNALTPRLLSAGTYIVIVGGRAATDRGAFNLTVTTTDPGAGDFCGAARPLTFFGPTATVSDDTSGATHDVLISTCEDPAANDLFYSFTVTGTQNVFATVTATGWQPTVSLRAAGCGGVDLRCANTASATNRLETTLSVGTYVVVVGGRTASDRGAFSLTVSVATVPGETCATVVDYTGTPSSPMAGDTTYARSEGNAYCGDASAGDVWYRVVLSSPQILTATVTAVGWQPTVSFGITCNSFYGQRCGTGSAGSARAEGYFGVGTVYVRVGGVGSADRGRFTLSITAVAAVARCPSDMAYVPAGSFLMGDADTASTGAQPPHMVTLSAYCMDLTEVTVAAYRGCTAPGCTTPRTGGNENYYNWGVAGRDNHPINGVDWNQSRSYCQWRGGDLPTEAQWEYAGRGSDVANHIYPWGNAAPASQLCWRSTASWICPVRTYPSDNSPFDLFDMAGNVCEWTRDFYASYTSASATDPTGPTSGTNRVVRGGSWNGGDADLRAARRGGGAPLDRSYLLGFRCARGAM